MRTLPGRVAAFFSMAWLIGVACSLPTSLTRPTPSPAPNETRAPADTREPTGTAPPSPTPVPPPTPSAQPTLTPAAALEPLEILEWSEFPYAQPADPANLDTHVEVLIRNPNEIPVRVAADGVELRFLNGEGITVYTNPNPVLYFWEGSWLLPGQTGALSACVCFQTSGLARADWQSLALVAPLEPATDIAYTLDVEVTVGEFFDLAEAHLGGSGLGAEITLLNRSEHALESIPHLVFARDTSGRYVGMAAYGNAVVSFTEDLNIQPGDSASGIVVSEIDYFDGPMTYEAQAIGIIASSATPTQPAAPVGTPLADWKGVPIMPGALNGGEAEGGYRYATAASIDAIKDYYDNALTELGYRLTTSGEEEGASFWMFQEGTTTVIIGVLPSDDLNRVQIAVLSAD
jgi:hypothetical protein